MIFYFRLARELGMSVSHLLQSFSSREISGWMAFLSLEEEEEKKKRQAEKAKQSREALDKFLTPK